MILLLILLPSVAICCNLLQSVQVGLAYWKGRIAAGVTDALASSLDYFPTIAALAGVPLPDREYDGLDLSKLLLSGDGSAGHSTLFHPLSGACGSGDLGAMRLGNFKAVWQTGGANGCNSPAAECKAHSPPLLFDLDADPAEEAALDTSIAKYTAIVRKMEQLLEEKNANISGSVRSTADYSKSAAGRAANCCNNKSPVCSCHP